MTTLGKHHNAVGQYASLGSEVFFQEFGSDWTSYRSARNRRRIDFSLTEINLSHNELVKLPDFSSLSQLSNSITSSLRSLAERCGSLLAEWVDATAEELHDRIDSMSEALFRDLRFQLVQGIKSVNERPMVWEPGKARRVGGTLYERMVSPWRARVLRPFLPVLCREPKEVLGPDGPPDRWAEYVGFDSFPDEAAEVIEAEMNLVGFQEKCARQGFGGFVVENALEDGMVKVYFKQHKAQSLSSLRRVMPKRTLHVRPVGAVKRTQASEEGDGKNYSWNAWVNGLAVLVSASTDPHNAAVCVAFDAHVAVVTHESDSQGFTEAALLGSSEAKNAFLRLLQLARNLMCASGDAGVKAARYFLEQKLHSRCWSRARRPPRPSGAVGAVVWRDLLDASGRERLLIGPTTGLVTCPDFDVRSGTQRDATVQLVAELPGSWDLIGKCRLRRARGPRMFVRNPSNTGQSFRAKFAKYAIRESFEMLTVNSRRETHNQEETKAKAALTEKIVELLMDCSRPLSGGLRKFLRRVDLMETIRKEFSLTKLAKVYQNYWKENENRMNVEVQERPDAIYQLLRVARWCTQELAPETPPSVLSKGLADFLQDNQAQAIDAGIMSSSQLIDLDKYKYFNQHDRRTNVSLVYLEFPTAQHLWESLQELLKRAQRLFLWQVRNRFRIPTALGEYYMALNCEDSSLHYAELRLCLSGKSKKLNTIQMFRETMKKAEEILHQIFGEQLRRATDGDCPGGAVPRIDAQEPVH
eukprot:g7465.t1